MKWHTPTEVAKELRMSVLEVRTACATGQMTYRPANPEAAKPRYLISDEAIAEYVRKTTVQATVRPLRRAG